MRILVLGASGMAGHTISIYMEEKGYDVTTFSRKPIPFGKNVIGDASDLETLGSLIMTGDFDVVINSIGILNNDAELNKHKAIFINSYLPHYISNLTKDINTRLIQMSTDCVFSGKTGKYSEHSIRDGETFYDRSKALGEVENNRDLTFRNSIVGPDINENGIGLFNWFMKQSGHINGYNKAIWTGVTTITLAKAMEKAIEDNLTGLYNLVNNKIITKYELLQLFNKYFKNNRLDITPSDNVILDKSLINNRTDFQFIVPSYEEMIEEMKEWVINHKELYSHYLNIMS